MMSTQHGGLFHSNYYRIVTVIELMSSLNTDNSVGNFHPPLIHLIDYIHRLYFIDDHLSHTSELFFYRVLQTVDELNSIQGQ